MVKVRVSVTIDAKTWMKIRDFMRKNSEHNKSRIIEEAILAKVGDGSEL